MLITWITAMLRCGLQMEIKPIEYVAMALSGEMQAYCDIEDDMVKGMFGTIVQGYLKRGIIGLQRR